MREYAFLLPVSVSFSLSEQTLLSVFSSQVTFDRSLSVQVLLSLVTMGTSNENEAVSPKSSLVSVLTFFFNGLSSVYLYVSITSSSYANEPIGYELIVLDGRVFSCVTLIVGFSFKFVLLASLIFSCRLLCVQES